MPSTKILVLAVFLACQTPLNFRDKKLRPKRFCKSRDAVEYRRVLRPRIAGERDEPRAPRQKFSRNGFRSFTAEVYVEHGGVAAVLLD